MLAMNPYGLRAKKKLRRRPVDDMRKILSSTSAKPISVSVDTTLLAG